MKLLLWVNNKGPFNIILGKETFIIGRSEECDFQIQNESISREHFSLLKNDDDQVFISDLHSHNGVRIGNQYVDVNKRLSFPQEIFLGEDVKVVLDTKGSYKSVSEKSKDFKKTKKKTSGFFWVFFILILIISLGLACFFLMEEYGITNLLK